MSVVETLYFKPLVDDSYETLGEYPGSNYTPYDLFKMKTKIVPKINRFIGDDVNVLFVSELRDDIMRLVVRFEKITLDGMNPQISLDEFQYETIKKWVNDSYSQYPDHALISFTGFDKMLGYNKISESWIRSVMPYINLHEKYNSFYSNQGIYVMLDNEGAFDEQWNNIIFDIRTIPQPTLLLL